MRTAARYAAEAGVADLQPDGRPRAVLVAGPGSVAECAADLLGALTGGSVSVTLIRPTGVAPAAGALRWALPGWAGPLDLLAVTSPDGAEPGLAVLLDQAYRRGCTMVALTPSGTPLVGAVERARGLHLPTTPAPLPEPDPGTGPGQPPTDADPYGADPTPPGTPRA